MMMVETVLESSQDFGMSCVWKREVCRRPPPPSPPARAPPPEEELRYGPGIVSRLKSRYLSLTTPELRRASSLETLEEAPPPAPPPAPRLPRARSVEALSPVRRPRRPTPLVPPAQRPAAAVKDSARRYDPPRRTPAPRVSAVVREFEARAGVRSNGTKYWSRPPPCVVSATNSVLVGSRRVGVIRPLPARAPSPRPPPSPSPRPPLSPSPRPRERTEHSEDQVDKSPQSLERPLSQIDRSPSHQEKSPPSAMVEPMPRFEEKLSIVQLWEQRISESPEKIVPKPKADHILPTKPEITTPKPEGITKPHFPTLKVEGVVKPNHTSPKIDGVTKPNFASPKPEPVTKPSLPSPKTELTKPSLPSPKTELTKPSFPSPKPDAITKPNFSTPKLETVIKTNHLPSNIDSSPKLIIQMPKYDTVTKPSFPSPKTDVPAAKQNITSPFIDTVIKPSFASPKAEMVTKPSFPSPKIDVPVPKSPILEAVNKQSFTSPKLDMVTKPSFPSPKIDVSAPKSPIVEAVNKQSFASPKPDMVMKPSFASPKIDVPAPKSPIVEAINKQNFASPKPELVSESVIKPNCPSPKTETISNKPDLIKIECKKTEPLTNGHKNEEDHIPDKQLTEPTTISEKIIGISEKIAKLDKISNSEKISIDKKKEKSPEPKLNGTCKISAAKIDRPWTKSEKDSDVSASVTVSESSPVRRHVRETPGSNSVVFNFSSRKEVPDYIENDGLILKAAKRDKLKAGDPGVVVLCPDLVRDLEDDDDDEEEMEHGPPSPCGVRFVNDNVLINGKSSLSHSATKCRNNKPRLQFDDSLTRTFEYPSETSLCEDSTAPQSPPPGSHNSLPTNTHISSSSLSAYSPWKTPRDTFTLGLSPLTHHTNTHSPTNGEAAPEVEEELPPSPPSWTEARTTNTDLLF